jgi:APA family basic amino acid/polyamine antiporter
VRGLSSLDVFGLGLFVIQPIYVIWWFIMAGFAIFQGANLWITLGITVVFLAVPSAIVWGVLGGSMPRSGGDYIYNTRILHPALGMVASMGVITGQIYWNMYMATYIAIPGLQLLGQIMGWQGLVDFAESKWGTFLCAVLLYVVAFLIVAFGWRIYLAIQRPLLIVTTALLAVCFLALQLTSKADFIGYWNQAAAANNSLNYTDFIAAAEKANGAVFSSAWTWGDTLAAVTASFLLVIYGYVSVYVGGEVKRPQKSLMIANWLSGLVTVALGVFCLWGLTHVAEARFLKASQYNVLNGPVDGYTLPYDTSINGLIYLGTGFNRVIGVTFALLWILTTISIFACIYVYMTRVLFAWGMDRMGPKAFSAVSARWAAPIKNYLIIAVICIACTAAYILWLQSNVAGLVGSGMALVTVFLITGIAATVFPYRRKARSVWDSSPYATWKVAGIPVITIAGVVYVVFVLLLIYYAYFDSRTRDITWKNLFSMLGVWAFGLAWYYLWRLRSKRADVPIDVVFQELPPE